MTKVKQWLNNAKNWQTIFKNIIAKNFIFFNDITHFLGIFAALLKILNILKTTIINLICVGELWVCDLADSQFAFN